MEFRPLLILLASLFGSLGWNVFMLVYAGVRFETVVVCGASSILWGIVGARYAFRSPE